MRGASVDTHVLVCITDVVANTAKFTRASVYIVLYTFAHINIST